MCAVYVLLVRKGINKVRPSRMSYGGVEQMVSPTMSSSSSNEEGVSTSAETSMLMRQQKLDRQRALLEQKKRQRQIQSGMVMSSGMRGRPTPTKYLRTTSRPPTAEPSRPGSAGSGSRPVLTPPPPTVSSSPLSDSPSSSPIKELESAPTSEQPTQAAHEHVGGSSSVESTNGSTEQQLQQDEPIGGGTSTSATRTQHELEQGRSQSGRRMQPDDIDGWSAAASVAAANTHTTGLSAAEKLAAMGIAASLDYGAQPEEEEENEPGEVISNPTTSDTFVTSSPEPDHDDSVAAVTPLADADLSTPLKAKQSDIIGRFGLQSGEHDKLRDFTMMPAPEGTTIKCRIERDKRGVDKHMFPTYNLYYESTEQSKTFLLAARKRKKSRSSNYLLSIDRNDLARDGEGFIAKVRSNFIGTSFTIFDCGQNPNKSRALPDGSNIREELAAVHYEKNVLGFKGPRKMTVVLPAMNREHKRIRVKPRKDSETLLERWKEKQMTDLLELHNKQPVWSEETQAYVLNFHGRVTQASVKNFQLVHSADVNYIVLQFGRISEDTFTLDYSFPISAVQAFAVALSSFDSKLACE